jgi:septal ring factor EnvC (AmiA/AmiB activator)
MFPFLLSLLLVALAADLAIETALADGSRLVMFAGTDLATGLALEQTMLIVVGAAVLATLVFTWSAMRIVRRRRTRSVQERSDLISHREAEFESRRRLVETRVGELQRSVEELTGKRDELVDELEQLRSRTAELDERIRAQHRELAHPPADNGERIVVVPEPETRSTS